MKIGILGSGQVAQTLGAGFLRHAHEAMLGSRSPEKLSGWREKNPKGRAGSFAEAARFGEIVVLAVKGLGAADTIRAADPAGLAGKIVIDTTNPIADAPPVGGVLKYFTTLDDSLMERLQREFPKIRFVKAFNSAGNASMVNPEFKGGRPSMFYCGDDESAKQEVRKIIKLFGWEAEDAGPAAAARAIEPLCMLWCIPGFLRNDWSHAFKVVR